MKILIFGNGQFAKAYAEYLPTKGHSVVIAEGVDIRIANDVANALDQHTPDAIINTAARTNLDWCEQYRLEAFDTNVLGTDTVAAEAERRGVYMLHISTGCIQESKTAEEAHTEEDPPTPTSFYSWTKYWADQMLQNRARRGSLKLLILRPRQPISAKASNRNAVVKMLTFTKFIDTPNSITILEDFIPVSEQLLSGGQTGLYNVANPGVMSPYKIALLLKEYVKPDLVIEKIEKSELNKMTLAERIDSVLDCSKLKKLGIHLKPADERLRELLPQLAADIAQNPEALQKTQAETAAKLSLK